ncbi:MAG: sialidase family protein [Candidatus Pacebacteria bacterium]|nr:sialidase family protein [Candidatus Paceibacterota bacterium]
MKKINFILLSIFFLSLAFLGTDAYANEIEWTSIEAPAQNAWRAVTYGEGKFVAVSSNGTNRIMISEDGKNWELAPFTWGGSQWFTGIAYGNGAFVLGNAWSGNVFYRSTDGGETWTGVPGVPLGSFSGIQIGDLAFVDDVFVAVDYSRSYSGKGAYKQIYISTDGLNWVAKGEEASKYWSGIAYGDGKIVVVGSKNQAATDGKHIAVSEDKGQTWQYFTAPVAGGGSWTSVAYGNGKFVAISEDDGAAQDIIVSSDGKNWTAYSSPDTKAMWEDIAFGNGYFVMVSYDYDNNLSEPGKAVAISKDGINWETVDTDPQHGYISVAYADNKFVAVAFESDDNNRILLGEFPPQKGSSSNIFGTRFCTAGVTTFCRPQNGFVNNNPLISIYTELLGLYQQLLSAMQGQEN